MYFNNVVSPSLTSLKRWVYEHGMCIRPINYKRYPNSFCVQLKLKDKTRKAAEMQQCYGGDRHFSVCSSRVLCACVIRIFLTARSVRQSSAAVSKTVRRDSTPRSIHFASAIEWQLKINIMGTPTLANVANMAQWITTVPIHTIFNLDLLRISTVKC